MIIIFVYEFYVMKEILSSLPERSESPREEGLTMMIDQGLSLRQAEDFLETSSKYTDIVKLGFGTSIISPNIDKKVALYKKQGMLVCTGGTLFEAFAVRGQLDKYKSYLDTIGITVVEISDGSMTIKHDLKCRYIEEFCKEFKVISEVGNKDSNIEMSSKEWIQQMQNELSSGSWKVIAEARESGNIGIFNDKGIVKSKLIDNITTIISLSDIIWETPKKSQQTWFINKFGANVNLGNISHENVIPLECLRLGLRADSFNKFI